MSITRLSHRLLLVFEGEIDFPILVCLLEKCSQLAAILPTQLACPLVTPTPMDRNNMLQQGWYSRRVFGQREAGWDVAN